jgi:hypothetical protein
VEDTLTADWIEAAIHRKARAVNVDLPGYARVLDELLQREIAKLNRSVIGAIVLDYDGTLRHLDSTGDKPDARAMSCLIAHLEAGLPVGIATGRDASLLRTLRQAVPQTLWRRVWVGVCNGDQVYRLDAHRGGRKDGRSLPELIRMRTILAAHPSVGRRIRMVSMPRQLTVAPICGLTTIELWPWVVQALDSSGLFGLRPVASTHSIDIIAGSVSKLNVLGALQRACPGVQPHTVLCIGDRGCWPYNDFELLGHDPALSVDEPSSLLNGAWNLAPPGCGGPDATTYYLSRIDRGSERFHLSLPAAPAPAPCALGAPKQGHPYGES